jgi:hypothetical protein
MKLLVSLPTQQQHSIRTTFGRYDNDDDDDDDVIIINIH